MESLPFRMAATGIIWGAVTIIMVAMIVTGTDLNFIIVGILAGAAWFSTDAVWDGAKQPANKAEMKIRAPAEIEKDKRDQRVEQLVGSLSQEELRQLRSRLVSSTDGEIVSLDDLLDEQESPRRRSDRV